jgi:hypothetical protein
MSEQIKTLIDWIKTFARKVRRDDKRFIVDGFDSAFYLLLDCTEVEEPENYPATVGTCDIYVVPLICDDWEEQKIRLVANANKFGVMRVIGAIGISRFSAKVKKAFYEGTNVLRTDHSTNPRGRHERS